MLLKQEEIDRFVLEGYVTSSRVLDDAAVERLRDDLAAILEERHPGKPLLLRNLLAGDSEYENTGAAGKVVMQAVNIWEGSEAFKELLHHPEITATVARLCNNTDTLRLDTPDTTKSCGNTATKSLLLSIRI